MVKVEIIQKYQCFFPVTGTVDRHLKKKEQSESFLFLTNEHTGTLCFTAFHFSVLWRYCKLKACGNPLLRKSTGAVFSTAPAHFVPLGYILVYLLK